MIHGSYCGWTKSCTTLKPWEAIAFWYLRGNRIIPGFLRCCDMEFATIHSGPLALRVVFGEPQGRGLESRKPGARTCGLKTREPENASPLQMKRKLRHRKKTTDSARGRCRTGHVGVKVGVNVTFSPKLCFIKVWHARRDLHGRPNIYPSSKKGRSWLPYVKSW